MKYALLVHDWNEISLMVSDSVRNCQPHNMRHYKDCSLWKMDIAEDCKKSYDTLCDNVYIKGALLSYTYKHKHESHHMVRCNAFSNSSCITCLLHKRDYTLPLSLSAALIMIRMIGDIHSPFLLPMTFHLFADLFIVPLSGAKHCFRY